MIKRLALTLIGGAAVLAGSGVACAAAPYDGLYVFGDSLVDAGNVFLQEGGLVPPPIGPNGVDYVNGRFTNGNNLADDLALAITGHVATPSNAAAPAIGAPAVDYGYGFARVVQTGAVPISGTPLSIDVPDLQQQIGAYGTASGGHADANALYTLTFGGNDLFALAAMTPDQQAAYAPQLIGGYVQGVAALEALGAKHILITGLPARDLASAELEAQFEAALNAFEASDAPDASVTFYSLSGFFAQAAADPTSVGLPANTQFTTACNQVLAASPACTGFFYFDAQNGVGVHPTAEVDRAVFNQIAPLLGLTSGVPEPTTWAELLLGFLFVGGTVRLARRPVIA